jgi:hypothetical protein
MVDWIVGSWMVSMGAWTPLVISVVCSYARGPWMHDNTDCSENARKASRDDSKRNSVPHKLPV